MKEQNNKLWETRIKPLFRSEILEFRVETLFYSGRYTNLDNAATTSPFKTVEDAVKTAIVEYGSVHRGSGQKSKLSTDKYENARETVRKFVGASPKNYAVFTKNTTEAINQAASLLSAISGKVLVSDIEHSSNLLPWLKNGDVVQYQTKIDGTLHVEEVERSLKENSDIKLVSITGSSNVTGYKPPIHKLARIAHKHGARVLVDACQLVPHAKINVKQDDSPEHIDFVTFSGHKMYAPFGSGVLIGPKEFFDGVMPYQIGGGNLPYITRDLQVKRFETVRAHDPGTPNALGAIAMAEAIRTLEEIGFDNIQDYEEDLVRRAYAKLRRLDSVIMHVKQENLGTVLPFEIKNLDSYLVAEILAQEYGIGVRAGSFCTYELLRKLKSVSDEQDRQISKEVDKGLTRNIPTLVRASFGLVNNSDDVERLSNALKEISQKKNSEYLERYAQDDKTGRYSLRGEK